MRERNGVPWPAGRVGNGKWKQPGWDAERRWRLSGVKRGGGKQSQGPQSDVRETQGTPQLSGQSL